MLNYLRSALFLIGMTISTIVMVLPCLFMGLFPYRHRMMVVDAWNGFNVWWLEISCGLSYRVTGLEHVPSHPCIVMPNHQSTWETLAMHRFFPPLTWVIKRELLWIPLFGWGLAATSPIALDRKAGKKALSKLVRSGIRRLQQGRWILIFPEGTRTPPGTTAPLKMGGFLLAAKAGATIIPVAHNSGKFWARKQFVKKSGIIDVVIGPPIECNQRSASDIKQQYEQWLTTTRASLDQS